MSTKNEYHLPCFLQWKDVLNDLNSYLDSKNIKKYSQPQFNHLVQRRFSNVKLPKYTRLGKCDTCLELKEKRLKAVNEEEKQKIQSQISEHNEKQLAERSHYKLRCLEAGMSTFNLLNWAMLLNSLEQNPDDFLSLLDY